MSAPRQELRVALLGQGSMGKAHSNAFAQVTRFFDVPFRLRLSVLCGRDPQTLERSAKLWGWDKKATDWRQVIERPDIDIVDIALPNHLHAEAAIAAAKAGKIVLCVASLVTFRNGSIGTLEATRFDVGWRNGNSFEIQGANGMLRFHLEDLNRPEFFDARGPAPLQGARNLLVTDPLHPYGTNFWRPGHIIGYEPTFIAGLGDFLLSLSRSEPFHPNFEDGLRVQQAFGAVLKSAQSSQWEAIAA